VEAGAAGERVRRELAGIAVQRRRDRIGDDDADQPEADDDRSWLYVDFANRLDTEPGFDYLFVDWSCDGGSWTSAPWIWDPAAGAWSGTRALSGQNASFPLYDTEKVAFKAPAGNVWIRFRFAADDLVGSPPYTGVAVDDVVVKR
jgi:hypothetical protein